MTRSCLNEPHGHLGGLERLVHHADQVVADGVEVDGLPHPAVNAVTTASALYRDRLNRRSTTRCTRFRSGLNRAAVISVQAATATADLNGSTCVVSSTRPV